MVARQLNVLGDGWVPAAEHEDIKFGVTGKDIFHPVPCHMESKADVLNLVIVRRKRELVCQAVGHGLFQHGSIVTAGVQGIYVLAEIGFPLGTVGISVNACA